MSAAIEDLLTAAFAQMEYARGFEIEPERWRFFRGPGQVMFCWNTTPIRHVQGDLYGDITYSVPDKGAWMSWVMEPYGPGSRSGKATRWRERPYSRSRAETRSDAKARAWRLYQEAQS